MATQSKTVLSSILSFSWLRGLRTPLPSGVIATPGAFGNPGKIKHGQPGTKLARKAAEKTVGVRVPTALAVVGGRIHIREVE